METANIYSSKAIDYARFRLQYAPEAINAVAEFINLTPEWVVADIGSGTGNLTQAFLRLGCRVCAVEPNDAMRRQAERLLESNPLFQSLSGTAESVPLLDASVDLITVGQAVHWFDAYRSRQQFDRILRPGGWMAFFSCKISDQPWLAKLSQLLPPSPDLGTGTAPSAYLSGTECKLFSFERSIWETWERFLGGARSAGSAPAPGNPAYTDFENIHRMVFETHSVDGLLEIIYSTHVDVGKFPK